MTEPMLMTTPAPLVMVSGCFDLLHSGHVAFLESAAQFGRLVVAVGSDRTVTALKGHAPWCSEAERLYLVRSLKVVESAFISSGSGHLDFATELRSLKPVFFVVNEDGNHEDKRRLCKELGVKYVVLKRNQPEGLPARSSSAIREHMAIPYRVEIAGGWLDQPEVSSLHPGSMVVASIEGQDSFTDRSGLATSSRAAAQRFWGPRLPPGDPLPLAQQLFALENPPGTKDVAGSQDQIGILVPGISRLYYEGRYWPSKIETIVDDFTLRWLESVLFLLPLGPRPNGFEVRKGERINFNSAASLAEAADKCWKAIAERDAQHLGHSLSACLEAQAQMFPAMIAPHVCDRLDKVRRAVIGAKFTGAGGGGYLVVVARQRPIDALAIRIRRPLNID